MATPPPSQDALRTIGLAAFENFTPDAAGPASAEKILERLSAARANSSGRVRQCGVELGVASGLHFQAALGVI
ncbi:hypothetical protein, partial [Sphingomonas aquatica]|uniref:hypothetical protein n=1 Tax=Sphingomonas aquatica TaxID=1763824 RepID=UPI00301CDC21